MKRMGRFINDLYLHMDLGFIVRAYAYSAIFMALAIYSSRYHLEPAWIVYCIICAVVFPFGYLLINDLLAILPFGGIFFLPIMESIVISLMMFPIKFVFFFLVWFTGILLAPLGILYIVLGDVFASWSERWKNKRNN